MAAIHFVRAGWLIDGSGSKPQQDVLLGIADGRIAAIERYSADMAAAAAVMDDLYFASVLPPLIDSHVHLTMSGTMDKDVREHQLTAGCDELEPVITRHLEQLFNHGVLAVRDGGDRDDCVARYLKQPNRVPYPVQVQSPGRAWHKAGRYGKLIGRSPADGEPLDEAYSREKSSGDCVKVVNSGLNSLKTFGKETKPQFDSEELGRLVKLAEAQGKKVMVHANGQQPVREAVEAGCHSIEHGFFMGRENLARMAERGCIWVPTACTMKAYAEILEHDHNQTGFDVARRNLEHQLEQLRMARELGVRVALGTDAGSPGVLHGESVFEEMKLFVRAGYSLAETVHCASAVSAELLGLPATGVLSVGQPADFLVARGTPGQLPRKLSYLENIYVGGRPSGLYRKNPHKHVQVGN